jgi:hypothetical protein
MSDIEYRKARVQFDLFALVRLCSFLGFCSGVVFIPITFIFNLAEENVYIVIGLPFIFLIQGAITALTAYPLYKLITNKYEFMYEGKFSIGKSRKQASDKGS